MTDRTLDALLADLVIANRILAHEGVLDDFGHVSARDPRDPSRFWVSASRSPELVTRADLLRFDLDAVPEDPGHRRPYLESIIHARIYAARPDVQAVVHHHARAVLPFSVTERRLRPVFHLASVLGESVPVWDSADEFGDTAMIIGDAAVADSHARAVGDGNSLLLRGHGATNAEASLAAVVFLAITLRDNAEVQAQAEAMGSVRYLSPGEIAMTRKMQMGERPLSRSWEYRRARAGFAGI
jgi:HCOMODA/2-hydroxy-3-carboxy-muconic semialdehyde decarboxylase